MPEFDTGPVLEMSWWESQVAHSCTTGRGSLYKWVSRQGVGKMCHLHCFARQKWAHPASGRTLHFFPWWLSLYFSGGPKSAHLFLAGHWPSEWASSEHGNFCKIQRSTALRRTSWSGSWMEVGVLHSATPLVSTAHLNRN